MVDEAPNFTTWPSRPRICSPSLAKPFLVSEDAAV